VYALRAPGKFPLDLRLLAVLAYVPIVLFATQADLWAPDEPRYAEVAREAWSKGSFIVLHLNGEVYPDKPPLLYWLAGASGTLFGFSELALRVPSLLATLGTAWIVSRLARRWWGAREAELAPFFWFTLAMVTYIGGRLQIDPLMTFFCLASIDLASSEPRPRMAAAGICAGLAAFCKGPVAWLHILFALLAWRLLPGAARTPLRRSGRAWTAFAALALGPVLVWALAATAQEPSLGRQLFFGQHIGRALEGKAHQGPLWDYLLDMPAELMPWTLLFVAAFVRAFRAWRRERAGDPDDAGLMRAASWFALVFVFFSILPTKRALYLLPIYPAAALLLAREAASCERAGGLPRWVRSGTAALLLLLGLFLCASGWFPERLEALVDVPESGDDAIQALYLLGGRLALVGAPLALAGAIAFLPRLPARRWTATVGAGFAVAASIYALVLVPAINPAKSAREVAAWVAARPEKPTSIACQGVRPEGYRFYAGVPASTEPLLPALEREGAQFLGLVDRKNWSKLSEEERSRFQVLRPWAPGGRNVIVLGAARR